MVIPLKDGIKLAGISVVACCAVFVCTLFISYNAALASAEEQIVTEAGLALYRAQVSTGKVVVAVTGGCLALTSLVMLVFYIKNYIDSHGRELGILKAMGYSRLCVAKCFWVFGLSVFAGCAVGFAAAYAYLPVFYRTQNAQSLLPDVAVRFDAALALYLVVLPAAVFAALSVLYALYRLGMPALGLLRGSRRQVCRAGRESGRELSFLQDLTRSILRRRTTVFFVAFSAFCFAAMVQMALSMHDLASAEMSCLVLAIGLLLAAVTLLMSLSNVVKTHAKTIAMMRVYGYCSGECRRAVFGGYRLFACCGFAAGTIYQYALLKIVTALLFEEFAPEYAFDFKALAVTLVLFGVAYELAVLAFAHKIGRLPLGSVMEEA